MEVKVNEIFQIIREENPSTGYTYFYEESTKGLRILKTEYTPELIEVKKRLFGAPGYHIWTVKATSIGRQAVELYYGQEWDRTTWDIEVVTIYVQ